ncbi:MAG TPA: hypothetical protein VFV98_18820 [Vicinamibacterales bacterium]|nr:hypothetical protein [Vicinamibacterales bacterium]
MRRVAALGCALVIATWLNGPTAGQGKLSAAHVNAAQRWLDGVVNHVPGQSDEHVARLVSMTAGDWRTLFEALPRALQTITGGGATTSTTEEKAIVTLAKDAVQKRGANQLLRRAAVMHADAAMLGGRMPLPEKRILDQYSGFVESRDGEVDRVVPANGHWPFARGLLDLLSRPRAADDPFVATWYHASAAYLMRVQQFGEVGTHLGRAAQLFPLDARIQFDLGAFSELLGLPRSRLVLDDPRTQQAIGSTSGQRLVADPRLLQSAGLLGFSRAGSIPTREAANAEAELRYRRALELDKTLIEARIRLGRLVTLRARYDDALKELDAAIAAKPDPVLLFYAHLFAGRAARGAGQSERAAVYFTRALALYPDAQSALLGASQVALVRADLQSALARVQRLETAMQSHPYDPWWDYHLGAGRQHETLLRAMWASVQ